MISMSAMRGNELDAEEPGGSAPEPADGAAPGARVHRLAAVRHPGCPHGRHQGVSARVPARIGVVGTGWWATRAHLPALEHHPDAVIAAIADPDEANRRQVVERFGVPPDRAYADVTSMLEGTTLDGAIVAVPHVLHAPVTRMLLEHGLPVLLEKPMTIDPADARALARWPASVGSSSSSAIRGNTTPTCDRSAGPSRAASIGEVEIVACLYRGDRPGHLSERAGVPDGPGEERPFIDPQPGTYCGSRRIAGGGQGQSQTTHLAALLVSLVGRRPVEVTAVLDRRGLGGRSHRRRHRPVRGWGAGHDRLDRFAHPGGR